MSSEFEQQVLERLDRIEAMIIAVQEAQTNQPSAPASRPQSNGPITDDSPMPFGKHAGTPMRLVPHDYLAWLFEQPDIRHKGVARWVEEKKAQLRAKKQGSSNPSPKPCIGDEPREGEVDENGYSIPF